MYGKLFQVDDFRCISKTHQNLNNFSQLLDHIEESIEISYNSAGVLAHMVSDGDDAWEELNVKRTDVMDKIVKVGFRKYKISSLK